MFRKGFYAVILLVLSALSLSAQEIKPAFDSDFTSLQGWQDASATGSPKSYEIDKEDGGSLRISTRAETKDRVKVATTQKFSAGEYTWNIFVPEMGAGDQASIGAFLYQDDKHEVDFEIGYGTNEIRDKLGAKEDELVCYFSSQGFPASRSQILVKRKNWYQCTIKIAYAENDKFSIEWFLNNVKVKTLQTEYSDEIRFAVYCSVENLTFMGDHLPAQENYAIFDSFQFTEIRKK